MIKGIGFEHEKFNFPCGEMHVKIKPSCQPGSRVSLHFTFEKNEDLVELLLVGDALKRYDVILEGITMPYVPFGRQDRVNVPGETFSLHVFASLVNSLNAEVVNIVDPHSDVTTALINNVYVTEQHEVFKKYFEVMIGSSVLICPDGGALKKIYKLSKLVGLPVIECSKNRDVKTGNITGITVHTDNLHAQHCYIVDDICDGGRTFVEIAKKLRDKNCGKIVLMVTHGFFTKGLEVFDNLIDEIYTIDGKVK